MKFHRLINLLLIIQLAVFISCEKTEHEYNSEDLTTKSQEIQVYTYENYCGIDNYNVIIPCKLYVKGGKPSDEGYSFSLKDSLLNKTGLKIEKSSGVILINALNLDSLKNFEVEVTDGNSISETKCYLNTQFINTGSKVPLPAFQFNSPETNLIYNKGTNYMAVSFSILGGIPPYSFSLKDGELPGNLSLNSKTGVISGDISMLEKGIYKFYLICSDSEEKLAISFVTAEKYEEFSIIIK